MNVRWLLGCAALGVLAACGGSDHGGGTSLNPLPAQYQGSWTRSACVNNNDGSMRDVSLSVGATSYVLVGTACTGSGCGGSCEYYEEHGTLSHAGTVTVDGVSAITIDRTPSGRSTIYDIAYVATAYSPDRLYDSAAHAVYDGSTPGARPIHLNTAYFVKHEY